MDNDIAIRVEKLGKRYRIGQTLDLTKTFRETLMVTPHLLGQRTRRILTTRFLSSKDGIGTDKPQDPVQNWITYERQFAASHAGYQKIRLEPGTFNGMRAALWEYRYRSGGTMLHAVNHTFVTRDGRFAYAFNFQTRDAGWQASAGLLQDLQRQFRARGSGA